MCTAHIRQKSIYDALKEVNGDFTKRAPNRDITNKNDAFLKGFSK